MKSFKQVLFWFLMIWVQNALGQRTEISVSVNSGFFYYAGSFPVSSTFINSYGSTNGYTNNPYGKKLGFSYGISSNIERITTGRWIYGLDLGYERLRSRVLLNEVFSGFFMNNSNPVNNSTPVSGKTNLGYGFINVFPFLGHRFNHRKFSWDLKVGSDLALPISGKEQGKATSQNGTVFTVSRAGIGVFDIRPRMELSLKIHKLGFYAGYSYGLINYTKGLVGGGPYTTYSRYIRLGASYTLDKLKLVK